IDFQDARMGPVQYDLVSLVHDSYVNLSDESREKVVEDYLMKASEFNNNISLESFRKIFSIQTIQRCFKACGSFASFYNLRKDLRYLKYLQPTVKKVVQTLTQHPEYSDFMNILIDKGLLEREYEKECKLSS
ncbi:MAG: hypothetical protein KDD22_05795, partial [Bdellovibrionales bacterium]|nr:hypothetical protein [Bdellovibrionales bacterium]